MTANPDQLANDYEQLKTTLELYPGITISKAEGSPPDTYEIEYRIKGYVRNPDGSITTADLHRVQISLPFGYPMFPPTVKPLTHIFHPDIDPAAIRIADQWQAKPSLSDLVLTIGEMICGNIYSQEDPFNQEAADWYEQHKDELPLDVLQIADIDGSDEQFDTLEDDAFSALGLDEEMFEEETEADESQVELLRLQVEQKNIFAASKILADLPATLDFPDRQELESIIAQGLRESDRMFKAIEELESQGNLDQAAAAVKRLEEVAADTPGLDSLRSRIQQSSAVADSFPVQDDTGKETKEKDLAPVSGSGKRPAQARVRTGSSLPFKPLLIVLFLVLLLGGTGFVFFKDKKRLDDEELRWQKILTLVHEHNFTEAQNEAKTALQSLDTLLLLKSSGRQLTEKINQLIASESFQQGLAGKILFQGRYVPFEVAEKIKQLNRLTEQAEELVKKGLIRKAVPIYEKALQFAETNHLDQESRQIRQTLNNLRFEQALAQAKQAESEQEWENAASTYRRALELSRSVSDPGEAEEISKRLAAATFRHELKQSKQAFTGAQWEQTIATLERAKELIEKNPNAVTAQEQEELNRLLLSSRLYQHLSLAREAYQRHDWETSIRQYQNALQLIDQEGKRLGPGIAHSRDKIERTRIMMEIARDKNLAARAEHKGDLAQAGRYYEAILRRINENGLDQDPGLRKVMNTVRNQLDTLRNQLDLQEKIDYLTENYQAIFKKYYPAFADSDLEHPTVTFNKKIGERLLFTMTCIERSQGSRSRLELRYVFDPATGRWSLFTGQ